MKISAKFLVISLLVILLGCDFMEYSDVSEEKSSSPFINTKYKSQKELIIYGITLDRNYKQVVSYYTVMEPPGIAGPEIVSKNILPKGSLIQIKRIERCNNCLPFVEKKRLIVEILSSNNKYSNGLIEIDLDRINIEETDIFMKID